MRKHQRPRSHLVPLPDNTAVKFVEALIDAVLNLVREATSLERAFLPDPLPTDEFAFWRRVEEGRGRLPLIANEVAHLAGTILMVHATTAARLTELRPLDQRYWRLAPGG